VADAFLQLSPEEQADILQTRAAKMGWRAEHLEKDVWICWVLQGLFGMPGRLPMAFKGGTSLSKVYGAIRRFFRGRGCYHRLQITRPEHRPFRSESVENSTRQVHGK
jgi:hypothetical protein